MRPWLRFWLVVSGMAMMGAVFSAWLQASNIVGWIGVLSFCG